MTLDEALAPGSLALAPGDETDWLPLCLVEVGSGAIWVGDPRRPEPGAGCLVALPANLYRVDGRVVAGPDGAPAVSGLRACRQELFDVARGPGLGAARTDSGLFGVCDLAMFTTGYGADSSRLAADLGGQVHGRCGVAVAPGLAATMAYAAAAFGEGEVAELLDRNRERAGVELVPRSTVRAR